MVTAGDRQGESTSRVERLDDLSAAVDEFRELLDNDEGLEAALDRLVATVQRAMARACGQRLNAGRSASPCRRRGRGGRALPAPPRMHAYLGPGAQGFGLPPVCTGLDMLPAAPDDHGASRIT